MPARPSCRNARRVGFPSNFLQPLIRARPAAAREGSPAPATRTMQWLWPIRHSAAGFPPRRERVEDADGSAATAPVGPHQVAAEARRGLCRREYLGADHIARPRGRRRSQPNALRCAVSRRHGFTSPRLRRSPPHPAGAGTPPRHAPASRPGRAQRRLSDAGAFHHRVPGACRRDARAVAEAPAQLIKGDSGLAPADANPRPNKLSFLRPALRLSRVPRGGHSRPIGTSPCRGSRSPDRHRCGGA